VNDKITRHLLGRHWRDWWDNSSLSLY